VDTVEVVEVAVTEIEEATGEVGVEIVDNMMIEEMIDLVEVEAVEVAEVTEVVVVPAEEDRMDTVIRLHLPTENYQ